MGFQNIEKKNFWYIFLRDIIASKWLNYVFYRSVSVNYIERIPEKGPLIFTPNHQNALIDAMAPLCNIDKQLVFLARSDIFKKKWVASILYFLKILPIFRIRDGYGELKKNEAIFSKTIDVLNSGSGLVLFPEGNHVRVHKLRTFKKGYARIAFQTAEANNFELDLKIVPVGINYSDYDHFRTDLTINIGQPISISEFYDQFKESPAIAINNLNKKLKEHLSPVMINIENDKVYKMIDSLSVLYQDEMSRKLGFKNSSGLNGFKAQKKIISLLEKENRNNFESFSRIKSDLKRYEELIKKSGNKADFPDKGDLSFINLFHNSFILLAGLPLFLYGLINNLLPFLLTISLTKKIKDITFKSSFAFVISLVIFPVFYLIQITLIVIYVNQWWIWIFYAFSLHASAAFALDYSAYFRKFKGKLRWLNFKLKGKKIYKQIKSAHQDLFKSLDKLQV